MYRIYSDPDKKSNLDTSHRLHFKENVIIKLSSSSMESNLLVGDKIFVTKYSYGYSKYSFPFSLPIIKGRIIDI